MRRYYLIRNDSNKILCVFEGCNKMQIIFCGTEKQGKNLIEPKTKGIQCLHTKYIQIDINLISVK